MKLAGFLVGAGLAGVAVFAFSSWRDISDDDRLTALLSDHCLPFVIEGIEPFGGLGRTPGVYDTVEPRLSEGNLSLLYDGRFAGEWGLEEVEGRPTRVCAVQPAYADGTVAAFQVDPDDFVPRYTAVLARTRDVQPEVNRIEDGPRSLGWFTDPSQRDTGLRVLMIVSPGLVTDVLVLNDLPE